MRHLSATMTAKTTLWMCVALAAAILAAWLMVVLATPTKRAEAAFPGNNGKIVFVRENDRDTDIVTMKANGDNQTKLTNSRADDYDPTFSPNGKKIAFGRNRSGTGDIYTMSANGTHLRRVTTSESGEGNPAWSPDGTKIAFSRERNGNTDIYVINQDGSGLTRITTSPKYDAHPAWSPDGTRIAFARGPSSVSTRIYVMKAARESETNIPQRLTPSGSGLTIESFPDWSPDGTRIAFAGDQTSVEKCPCQLFTIRADGSDLIRLTNLSRGFIRPAWSPDGTKIAFSARRDVHTFGIYVMKAKPESATNRPKRLTGTLFGAFDPDWQPLP